MRPEEKERLHEDDAFVKFVSSVRDKVVARRRHVLIGLGVLVVVAVVLIASAIMAEVSRDARLSTIDRAETIEEMGAAAKQYPRDAGLLLRLGAAYASRGKEGDAVKAQESLQRAVDAAGPGLTHGVALLALGKVQMDLDDHEAALKQFEAASVEPASQSLVKNEANWHAGRCLELLGRPEQAEKKYDEIVSYASRDSGDVWVQLAEYRRVKLRQASLE